MKNLLITLIAVLAITISTNAQAPGSIKYQAVLRDATGAILTNQTVDMQFTVYNASMVMEWQQTYTVTSNAYGLVNIELGSGLDAVPWGTDTFSMETAVDFQDGNGMTVMGTSTLLSVPYAFYANTADFSNLAENVVNDAVDDADNDPTNEIETWSTLSGIPADIADGDDVDDADNDPTNEIETWTTLGGIPADILDGDDVDDADNDPTNEIETWSTLAGIPADIADGDDVDDADNDPTNEIELPAGGSDDQVLTLSGGSPVWADVPKPVSNVQVDPNARTVTTAWAIGPTFTNITGFKAGSKVKLTYTVPCRNDDAGWGGMYIEPQVSFNGGASWNSLGSSGYDGNVMVLNGGGIGTYTNVILIDPGMAADFSVQVRFYYKTYSGTGYVNSQHDLTAVSGSAPLMSGINGSQHYTKIIVEEVY